MKTYPVFREQQSAFGGATHFSEITFADLTAAGNTQTLAGLIAQKANVMGIRALFACVVTPFVSSDGTLISTALTLGDANSANRYLTSTELNAANGTPPVPGQTKIGALADSAIYVAAADITVDAVLTATATKALNTHTAGRVLVFWQVYDDRLLN